MLARSGISFIFINFSLVLAQIGYELDLAHNAYEIAQVQNVYEPGQIPRINSQLSARLFPSLNQDPRLADPRHAVKCTGDLPPFDHMNRPPGTRDSDVTLQKICAQAQYGGFPRPFNAEIRCDLWDSSGNSQIWGRAHRFGSGVFPGIFDVGHVQGEPAADEATVRLIAYCALRCPCSGLRADEPQELRYVAEQSGGNLPTVTIDLGNRHNRDRANPRTAQERNGPVFLGRRKVLSVMQQSISPSAQNRDFGNEITSITRLGIVRHNQIRCNGPWPNFQLPPPATRMMYRRVDFSEEYVVGGLKKLGTSFLTRICAVALSFGHNRLNAGGYCHRSEGNSSEGDIWFSDEMTPDPSWTFKPPASLNTPFSTRMAVLELRHHCASYCYCVDPSIRTRKPLANVFAWLAGDVARMSFVPPSASPTADTGDPREQEPTPTAVDTTLIAPGSEAEQTKCSQRCSSVRDCAPDRDAGGESQCKSPRTCVAERFTQVAKGRDRLGGLYNDRKNVWSQGRCAPYRRRPGRLDGRNMREEEHSYCVCNSSYVSLQCCGSQDGIVWEAMHKNMRILLHIEDDRLA